MSEIPKIEAHVAMAWNVAKLEETDGALPTEEYMPPTVWIEMHSADSHKARLLTGSREPLALIFERAYADPNERLVGYLHQEDIVHLHRFFVLGNV